RSTGAAHAITRRGSGRSPSLHAGSSARGCRWVPPSARRGRARITPRGFLGDGHDALHGARLLVFFRDRLPAGERGEAPGATAGGVACCPRPLAGVANVPTAGGGAGTAGARRFAALSHPWTAPAVGWIR